MRIPLTMLLIAALLAGQTDRLSGAANALLRKPRVGNARIVWHDGTYDSVRILRVTDHFIGIERQGACRNVALQDIAKVEWEPTRRTPAGRTWDEQVGAVIFYGLVVILIPTIWARHVMDIHDSKLGSWESIPSQPGDAVERLELTYKDRGELHRHIAQLRKGRYRFEYGILYIRYDDGTKEAAAPASFECNGLTIGIATPSRLRALLVKGPASAPIVGRFLRRLDSPGPDAWEFRPDGTFQTEILKETAKGFYTNSKGGIDIVWNRYLEETWRIQKGGSSLFITRNGSTTEFKRRTPFD